MSSGTKVLWKTVTPFFVNICRDAINFCSFVVFWQNNSVFCLWPCSVLVYNVYLSKSLQLFFFSVSEESKKVHKSIVPGQILILRECRNCSVLLWNWVWLIWPIFSQCILYLPPENMFLGGRCIENEWVKSTSPCLYRNQSINIDCRSMVWLLYDNAEPCPSFLNTSVSINEIALDLTF